MMKNLNAFLNPQKVDVEKVVISDRFIDPETNKPIEWEIGAVSGKKNNEIQSDCTITKKVNGKLETDINADRYLTLLICASVVYPELNNKDLQDAYGVKSAEDLIGVMLTSGEMIKLQKTVNRINGLDQSFESLTVEAKN